MKDRLIERHKGAIAWGSSGPLREGKGTTFEGGQRVPCLMRGPGIPANTVCNELTGTIDVLPTIAAITGRPLPEGTKIDGVDVSGLWMAKAKESPREEFVHYTSRGEVEGIRKGNWKLLLCRGSGGWSPPREPEAAQLRLGACLVLAPERLDQPVEVRGLEVGARVDDVEDEPLVVAEPARVGVTPGHQLGDVDLCGRRRRRCRIVRHHLQIVGLVVGDVGETALRRAAEEIERDLLSQRGVSLVSLEGARDYEISIEIDETTLRRYGLSFDEVANAAFWFGLIGGVLGEYGDIAKVMDFDDAKAIVHGDCENNA